MLFNYTQIKLFLLGILMIQNLHATRPCAVSGSFYPENKEELSLEIKQVLANAKSFSKEDINAIIVPHAGYIYSAQTAAQAYKTLHKKYKNIFLIGSSHHINSNTASIYNIGSYQTPLGLIKTNKEIISALMQNTKLFSYEKDAHTKEHTLEVQLPFLQTIYQDGLQIVPIIIATQKLDTIIKISQALKPYFTDENLFIISTDLSHFPKFDDANNVDMRTLKAISTNNSQEFIDTLNENESLGLKNFHTSACGWSSILTLMQLTKDKNYKYELLEYKNSAHIKNGDKSRVVGYGAMRIYKDKPYLNTQEKSQLLEIAKLALDDAIRKNERIQINEKKVYPKLLEHLGAFVTLYKDGNLRGCIGSFEPNQSLYEVVIDMAISSAFNDTRFNKVTLEELSEIDIEISVLTPRRKINSLEEIELHKHGIYVKHGSKSGTYLPHVASQMQWNVKEFIHHCAIEKAGISPQNINDIEIFTYETIIFGEKK